MRTNADKVKALTAKKVPELVDTVQNAAAEPGKAVSKAFKQARVCVMSAIAVQASLKVHGEPTVTVPLLPRHVYAVL